MKSIRLGAIAIAILSCGCGGGDDRRFLINPSPVAPPPPSAPAPAPVPQSLHALSGVVRAGGVPVAGVKVALLKFEESALTASVLTDESGAYRFTSVAPVTSSGALVSVSKPDYFTDTRYIAMSQDQRVDFDLERAVHISVGQVIQSQVGEARCASLGYGHPPGALCRRFALVAPSSGSLEVTVSSTPSPPFDISVLNPDGTIGANVPGYSPVRVRLQVAAGSTYQVDVVHISLQTRDFELFTTLQ